MVGDIVAIGENINRLNAGTPAGKMLTPANLAALSQQVRAGTANLRLFRWRTETSALRCRTRGAGTGAALDGSEPSSTDGGGATGRGALGRRRGSLRLHPRHRRLPCRRYPAQRRRPAPRASAREHLSQFGVRRQRRGRAAGCRARCATPRQSCASCASSPWPEGRRRRADRHAAEIAKAERDVELARTAERAAAERWSRATDGSPIARAAMGQTTAE